MRLKEEADRKSKEEAERKMEQAKQEINMKMDLIEEKRKVVIE